MADDAFSVYLKSKSLTLEQVFSAAVTHNLPVAIWRLPETNSVQACVSFRPAIPVEQPSLEQSPFGFLFCPFTVSPEQPNLFIKADVVFDATTGELQPAGDISKDEFKSFIESLDKADPTLPAKWHLPALSSTLEIKSETGFIKVVEAGIKAIRQEKMEKVVLSRSKTEALPPDFDPLAVFKKMLKPYPKGFVSLVSIPDTGTWLGASPEILVSIDQHQVFRTVALAGTQPADSETSLANAIWRQKEIEEQGMVERYILSCFKKLRLREYTEVGPRTIVAGNLMHLRTDFKVDLQEVDFPTLGTDMLHLLHPTSAICGLPKEPALEFINANEGYDRSYYSGYLGPVNSNTGTHLFVNLRCMQLLAGKAILYAGAGITAESSPEKEYQETLFKMQTMRKVLGVEEFGS